MSRLTYFMWIDNYDTNMSPDEEMEEYLRQFCPIPSDEDLCRLEKEVEGK